VNDEEKDQPDESGLPDDKSFEKPPSFFKSDFDHSDDREIEVKVIGVFQHEEPGATIQRFVLVQDNKGRRVPILIGPFEALSITMAIENESPPRPLTHDLMKTFIEKLGASVEKALVDDLWNEVFYAKVYLSQNDQLIEIDSRPSDAIALAIRFKAPIYMSESIIESTRQEE
jgi:bifunctional DNase/RNase